jgi:hypothetical protein
MMQSQLGRIVLGGSTATEDAMNLRPDPEGGYGSLDEIIAAVGAELSGSADAADYPFHLGHVEGPHGGGADIPQR